MRLQLLLSQLNLRPRTTHLNLNVPNFSVGANERTADHSREDVFWEVGAGKPTLDKLEGERERARKRKRVKQTLCLCTAVTIVV